MPSEIDFSEGVRGLHHVPSDAKVFLPASIERSVWEYFADKAEQKGVGLPDLLTDVLKRDIEINEGAEVTSSPRNLSAASEPFQLHTIAGKLVEPELNPDRTSALDMLGDESKFVGLGNKSSDADTDLELFEQATDQSLAGWARSTALGN